MYYAMERHDRASDASHWLRRAAWGLGLRFNEEAHRPIPRWSPGVLDR